MKIKDYEEFVQGKAKTPIADHVYSFIGLAGETGECMEWLKKAHYRKDPRFTEQDLLNELGDVIHYVTRIGLYYGWGLKDIIKANIIKLEERYGQTTKA